MVWPGLNAPILRGRELVQQQLLPKDEEREAKLIKMRDSMGRFRSLQLDPLERGWSGTKMPGRSIGPPDPIGEGEKVEEAEKCVRGLLFILCIYSVCISRVVANFDPQTGDRLLSHVILWMHSDIVGVWFRGFGC